MKNNIFHELFAPKACVFCDELMSINTNIPVCKDCKSKIPFVKGKTCAVCGVPLSDTYLDIYCGRCKKKKFYFESNVSRYVYKGIVKDALLKMKFGKLQLWVARIFGEFLADTIAKEYERVNFDCILYVPSSVKRMYERKFNQSHIIADAVSEKLGIEIYDDVLYKVKDNLKQSSISDMKKREENVKGAYDVYRHDKIIDKTVLLIDDIFTTGSTINECAKTLKKFGAAIVYTATVAVVKKLE